jgi:hypothetical protein
MKHVKIALFSTTFVFLPRILQSVHVDRMLAYGLGALIALAMYLIPSKDEEPLPLRRWLLFSIPFAFVVAFVFGKMWPE